MRKKLETSHPLRFMISSATLRDAVLAGGIRRAALISFSRLMMKKCSEPKQGHGGNSIHNEEEQTTL